ncbi:hypothetical protein ACFX2I_001960 [Malus domestica]|uniref:Uncharacterized protein n=1 Tax=Malus domestica TaxID=3750 RepID=A0A498KML8_MALDO|nr:hypothetical protein DVH24_022555 [Malus domestica]
MESQMARPHDHEDNRHTQHLVTHQGEEEDHQEKSVLKKVKEKAKKIKNKLTKHGHEHEHDHNDLDKEDDEEDEDPEVHGATTIRSGAPGQGDILKVPMVRFGDTKAAIQDRDPPEVPHLERTDPMKEYVPTGGHLGQTRVHLHHRGLDDRTPISSRGDYQKTNVNVTDPSHAFATRKEGHFGQSGVNLDRPRGLEEDPHAPKANPQGYTPSNYETKVTDPTHAGGEEIGISPILHSFNKIKIHGGDAKPSSNRGSSYTEKVSSATSAIAEEAISAKNAVASKLGYGGGNNDQHEDVNPHAYSPAHDSTNTGLHHYVGTNQNPSTGSHDQFSPEHPSNQGGSYTEKVSSATSAIADKAISAKNAVASKLGYGGDTDQQQHGDQAAVRSGSAAPGQQGKGITAAVTEKLTPVYEKVAGAGSAVMSKLPGGVGTAGKEEVHRSTGTATTGGEYNKSGQDKGISVKGYLFEKLKPGEEDRALSEVISETLHMHKAEQPRSGARPVGKVTESMEVTQRLGPDYGDGDVQQSSYGKVVADTVKGAVGSLLGKADESATSPQSLGSSIGTEGFSSSGSGVAERRGHGDAEQRRLQGSSN